MELADPASENAETVMDIRVGLRGVRGKFIKAVKVAVMVSAVLDSCSHNKFIERLHLFCHILHLVVHYTNSLFMNRFRSILDQSVLFVDFLREC